MKIHKNITIIWGKVTYCKKTIKNLKNEKTEIRALYC